MFSEENWGTFFKNKNLVLLVDTIAKRYGIPPSEVMGMSLYEFNLNTAIVAFAIEEERKAHEEAMRDMNKGKGLPVSKGKKGWNKFGINHKVVKKSEKKSK